MKGKLAAVALAAGVLLAGCGDDGSDGDGSTAQICEDMNQVVDPLDTNLNSLMTAAGAAAAAGDEAALEQAAADLREVIDEITTALRDGADRADEEEFAGTLRAFADEWDALEQSIVTGEVPDTTAIARTADEIAQYCGTE